MNQFIRNIDIVWENLPFLLNGLELTIILAIVSNFVSFFLGIALALCRLSKRFLISYPATGYIEVVRATPLIMVIFWVYFMIPIVTHMTANVITSVLIAFIGFNCSYIAEIVRAGILSLPKGQAEAAKVTGLNYFETMYYVILPQALKNMIPAVINRFVATLKSTSLAYIIGATEFFRAAVIVNNREFVPYEIFAFVAVVYFICCYVLSLGSQIIEKRLTVGQR